MGSKYRPVGKRGIAFNVAHDEYQSGEPRTKLDNANSTNILIAMIESKEGIDNVNDIISTKGINMAWLGHFDLTDSLGVPGNFKIERPPPNGGGFRLPTESRVRD